MHAAHAGPVRPGRRADPWPHRDPSASRRAAIARRCSWSHARSTLPSTSLGRCAFSSRPSRGTTKRVYSWCRDSMRHARSLRVWWSSAASDPTSQRSSGCGRFSCGRAPHRLAVPLVPAPRPRLPTQRSIRERRADAAMRPFPPSSEERRAPDGPADQRCQPVHSASVRAAAATQVAVRQSVTPVGTPARRAHR